MAQAYPDVGNGLISNNVLRSTRCARSTRIDVLPTVMVNVIIPIRHAATRGEGRTRWGRKLILGGDPGAISGPADGYRWGGPGTVQERSSDRTDQGEIRQGSASLLGLASSRRPATHTSISAMVVVPDASMSITP